MAVMGLCCAATLVQALLFGAFIACSRAPQEAPSHTEVNQASLEQTECVQGVCGDTQPSPLSASAGTPPTPIAIQSQAPSFPRGGQVQDAHVSTPQVDTPVRVVEERSETPIILRVTSTPESSPGETGMYFKDVTQSAGINHFHVPPKPSYRLNEPSWMAGGAVAEDFDGDGWVDLFVLRGGGSPALLYINRGDGSFSDQAKSRGAALNSQWGMGAAAADYDNDGDVDIVVTNYLGPHVLLVNQGDGHFQSDTSMLKVPRIYVTSPAWGDVDNDGLLELAIGEWSHDDVEWSKVNGLSHLWLYRNMGGGTLEPYDFRAARFTDTDIMAPRFADVNGDRLTDLVVTADYNNSQIYLNVGEGRFQNLTDASGVSVDEHGMGSAIGDYDNDGDLDWFVASIFDATGTLGSRGFVGNRMYRNEGDGVFVDATDFSGVKNGNWAWGASFGDLDNDGDLDLFHVTGWSSTREDGYAELFNDQPARLFKNRGDGTFEDVGSQVGAGNRGQGRGTILFDYDNDGDLDIFVTNNEVLLYDGRNESRRPARPALIRNETSNGYHWLKVTLRGTPPLHRHGIGSRVYVTTDGVTQMRELHASTNFMAQEPGRIAHFGVGPATVVDEVRAEWVNGDATVLSTVAVDQIISIPSPTARVSARRVAVGAEVTVKASDTSVVGGTVEWEIGNQTHQDPVTISFDSAGVREFKLHVYGSEGTGRIRSEVLRVTVVED